ncbi:unnamed protein product [Blepharisma stoltei]|uniref:Importin subunit alpha n=1 Tax=Blepharisma stoltei TaxID=1481888 RepID=A0AAU9JCG4_9CILI|nr:unnamed protein product [Blepharisma stoltei]
MISTPSRLEDRNHSFQSIITLEEHNSQREKFTAQLRKTKRLENANKRRDIMSESEGEAHYSDSLLAAIPQLSNPYLDSREKLESFYYLISTTQSDEIRYSALNSVRRLLSQSSAIPIKQAAEIGYIQLLIFYLNPQNRIEIQLEASWCLCNLAASDNGIVEKLVNSGAVQACLDVLNKENQEVAEHAIWCIGNIAGDYHAHFRQQMIDSGIIGILINFLEEKDRLTREVMRTGAWTLHNLVRKRVVIPEDTCKALLIFLKNWLDECEPAIKIDCLWAVAFLAEGGEKQIQLVIDSQILKRVTKYAKMHTGKFKEPILRIFGNILTGNSQQEQVLLNLKILDILHETLQSKSAKIKKDALWSLSNLAASSRAQISKIVEHPVIKKAMRFLIDPNLMIRKEACFIFVNIVRLGMYSSILSLLDSEILVILKESLDTLDPEILKLILEIAKGLLRAGSQNISSDGNNKVSRMYEDAGILDIIQDIRINNANEKIQEAAETIIKQFFSTEQNEIVPLMTPDSYEFS